ncbi:MAG: hypothetical protein D9N11_01680 [Ketobacter sp.]|nr:MAG: hypothetical protein D9N11_01680 [Ketobacter sp.]
MYSPETNPLFLEPCLERRHDIAKGSRFHVVLLSLGGFWHNAPLFFSQPGPGVVLKPLLALFWQMCLFRRGPQDVPYSPVLLIVLVLVELALGAGIIMTVEPLYMEQQLLGVTVALGAWLVMVWGILRFKGLDSRYVQAMTACLGTDLLLSLIILPLQLYIVTGAGEGLLSTASRLALLVVLIWDILVKGWIYAGSMQLGRLQGNLLSITIWVVVLLLSDVFLPPEALEALRQAQTPTE